MKQHDVIVIVPTYNNPLSIKAVISDILNHGYKVIVSDDGSDIAVASLYENEPNEDIYFIRHEKNKGKGEAISSATKKAKELGYLYVLSMDGDGQHLAAEAHKLIDVLEEETILIGARNFNLDNVPLGSKFGRWFSNMWACWDTGHSITDSLSGYRIYPISIIDLPIQTHRFDWEMEVLVRHADTGKKIKEVVIECYYPLAEDRVSHFRKFEDTMAIVWVHIQILPFKWLKWLNPLSK